MTYIVVVIVIGFFIRTYRIFGVRAVICEGVKMAQRTMFITASILTTIHKDIFMDAFMYEHGLPTD